MRQALTRSSTPAQQPVTLDEVKTWARIDGNSEDALLTQLIGMATESAEQYLRRSLITQTWVLTKDLDSCGLELGEGVYDLPVTALYGGLPRTIDLPKGPVQSITSVVTYSLEGTPSTFDPSNYTLDTAGKRLVLAYGASWPSNVRPIAACEITYKTGYGDAQTSIPQPIKTAIIITAASLYENRGMCEDGDLPPAAKHLLNQYRVIGRG